MEKTTLISGVTTIAQTGAKISLASLYFTENFAVFVIICGIFHMFGLSISSSEKTRNNFWNGVLFVMALSIMGQFLIHSWPEYEIMIYITIALGCIFPSKAIGFLARSADKISNNKK